MSQDNEYNKIIRSYESNEEFQKLKNIEHHGTTRYHHSKRVSYYSYKITKILHLNYKEAAIGGLLHDFFITDPNWTNKERMKSFFVHPKKALKTAEKNFELTNKEKDIIRSHMFPANLSVPKYMETWIVSAVDKVCALNEFCVNFKVQVKYAYSLAFLFIFNMIK